MRFTYDDLNNRYAEMTTSVICECEAVNPFAGGMSAEDDGIRSFIRHHLKISDPVKQEETFKRIKEEELGEKAIPSAEGELKEQLTYGINVIRRTAIGPYLGSWMIHANLKTAASRLGLFVEFRGAKGNMAEAGVVIPYGRSRLDDRPDCVYLVDSKDQPASTYFAEIKGKVSSTRGSVSIMHHSECVPIGTRYAYEFKFIKGNFKMEDIRDFLALSMVVGMGSAKSLGNGKFRILSADIVEAKDARKKKEMEAKKKEKDEVKQASA